MVKRKSTVTPVSNDDDDVILVSASNEIVEVHASDSDSEAGGFIIPEKKKRKTSSARAKPRAAPKRTTRATKNNAAMPSSNNSTMDTTPNPGNSSYSDLSTPPSSNEEDDELLSMGMSSMQATSSSSPAKTRPSRAAKKAANAALSGSSSKLETKSKSAVRGKALLEYEEAEEDIIVISKDDPYEEEEGEEDDELEVELEVEEDDTIESESSRTPRDRKQRDGSAPRIPRHIQIYQKKNAALQENHPELKTIFDDLINREKIIPEQIPQPEGMACNLLPFQKEGLNWLLKQEKGIYKGGILADEMGMGKTIQTVALFMSDPPNSPPTLVVAPTVALIQWKNEIDMHTRGKLSVLLYHGQNRSSDTAHLESFNVILTTYAVLESVYRKQQSGFRRKGGIVKEESPLHKIHFNRIVLDEAHNIKDRQSNTARAVFNMKANYRLCLSGTPLQNRIGEIYSLIRFLNIEPFCNYYCSKCDCASHTWNFTTSSHCDICDHVVMQHVNFFNHSLLKHIQRHGYSGDGGIAMNNMRTLLGQIMLRRTKIERADDLGLPPRVVEIRRDYFNEEEKDLYASIYSDSNRKFTTYVNSGVVLNNYANIFTLITRMRQIADHPDLVLRRHVGGVQSDATTNLLVCNICDDEAEEAIKSRCHHTFCRLCIKEYVEGWTGNESDLECPVCHVQLTIDLTAPAIEVDEQVVKKGSIVNRINMTGGWRSSTKIEGLVEELYKLRSDRQTIKSIVFSQFTSMLDLVEWRLKRAGFQTVKLQGSMSPTQRDNIIRHFMTTPSVEVFLVSLKAGGVALNLCEASQVFILDPWWNPSVEWQSGDRVHRIGQHRPVKITRLVIEDSIESRIIELQEKKARMIQATIGSDDAAMNKLTPADMQFLFQN